MTDLEVGMAGGLARKLWTRVSSWIVQNSAHVTVRFLPDGGGQPVAPHGGYMRLFLAEGFLAQQQSWGAKHFPALHGGVSLTFLGGGQSAFTTFSRPPEAWTTPGAQLDFPITPLLPFSGGTVELQAALYQATVEGPLNTAMDLLGSFASLMGPPLSAAATIADKVSDGLDHLLAATGSQPLLGVHWTMVAPGGGGNVLHPGHLVVLNAPQDRLAGAPVIRDGRLHLEQGARVSLPTGVDYLALRVECRPERDDWRMPQLDALIRSAGEAFIRGHREVFADCRTEAIAQAWNSTDLVANDRKRVALLVKEELDSLGDLGAVPGPERTLGAIAPERLPASDDHRLDGLSLAGLLTG